MTQKNAWDELTSKFPYLIEDQCSPIYFWQPGEDTPVSIHHEAKDHKDGWRWTCFAEDIPVAFLVVRTPDAIGQIVVYAKWPRQGWEANPQTRHLINHLVGRANEAKA